MKQIVYTYFCLAFALSWYIFSRGISLHWSRGLPKYCVWIDQNLELYTVSIIFLITHKGNAKNHKTKFIRQYAIPLKSISWKKLLLTALHMFCMIEHPSSKTCLFHGRETSGNFVQANAVSEIFFFFKKNCALV